MCYSSISSFYSSHLPTFCCCTIFSLQIHIFFCHMLLLLFSLLCYYVFFSRLVILFEVSHDFLFKFIIFSYFSFSSSLLVAIFLSSFYISHSNSSHSLKFLAIFGMFSLFLTIYSLPYYQRTCLCWERFVSLFLMRTQFTFYIYKKNLFNSTHFSRPLHNFSSLHKIKDKTDMDSTHF